MKQVVVSGAFDDLRSRDIRFLEEAARLGPVTVALWDDDRVAAETGRCVFPFAERAYLLEALRFVARVEQGDRPDALAQPVRSIIRVTREGDEVDAETAVIPDAALEGFPVPSFDPATITDERKRVIVTGCYDWFHSGHVRFFEACSQLGDLYVVAG